MHPYGTTGTATLELKAPFRLKCYDIDDQDLLVQATLLPGIHKGTLEEKTGADGRNEEYVSFRFIGRISRAKLQAYVRDDPHGARLIVPSEEAPSTQELQSA